MANRFKCRSRRSDRKYHYNALPAKQDNKGYYAGWKGLGYATPENAAMMSLGYDTIRVPSMKRSKSTWKRFYNLFPNLRYQNQYRGSKLKKV